MQQPEVVPLLGDRLVDVRDYPALLLDPLRRQTVGDAQTLRVVSQHLVPQAASDRLADHSFDRIVPVRPVGMRVAIALQVGPRHERGELSGHGRFDLAAVLAQLRLMYGGSRKPYTSASVANVVRVVSSLSDVKPCSDNDQPLSRAMARKRTL